MTTSNKSPMLLEVSNKQAEAHGHDSPDDRCSVMSKKWTRTRKATEAYWKAHRKSFTDLVAEARGEEAPTKVRAVSAYYDENVRPITWEVDRIMGAELQVMFDTEGLTGAMMDALTDPAGRNIRPTPVRLSIVEAHADYRVRDGRAREDLAAWERELEIDEGEVEDEEELSLSDDDRLDRRINRLAAAVERLERLIRHLDGGQVDD